jgi:hypothetical protein
MQLKDEGVGAILAAALALPGLQAMAETAPEQAELSVKYMHYQDSQPGLDRISVRAPSIALRLPIAGVWSLDTSLTSDDVSGASPRYHTAISGASHMADVRTAGDVKVTRYFPQGSVAGTFAYSTEHDYQSRAFSLQGNLESESKNTTWTFGVGGAYDSINPVNYIVTGERRRTVELMIGGTQVLTAQDIALVNLSHVRGRGYFDDPYKYVDARPRERDQSVLALRWNHHFKAGEGTSRASYRYYSDTFGVRAHTLGLEYEQPFGQGWSVTPALRWYRQQAASFYFDPVYDKAFGAPFPPGYVFNSGLFSSADQRLSAFDAHTLGIKLQKALTPDWTVDLQLDRYRQFGAKGLAEFTANTVLLGLATRW